MKIVSHLQYGALKGQTIAHVETIDGPLGALGYIARRILQSFKY